MESTYGDKDHENRRDRITRFKSIIEKALQNNGTVLIPAFSIGRTQELLYELEEIIHQEMVGASLCVKNAQNKLYEPAHSGEKNMAAEINGTVPVEKTPINWPILEIILDSPLAAKFTQTSGQLKHCWDKEALRKVKMGRRQLTFDNLTTINTHKEHVQTVEYLANNKRPAIVIATSDMCNGRRVINYLKAMLGDARHDVLFVGYQTSGTMGRLMQSMVLVLDM